MIAMDWAGVIMGGLMVGVALVIRQFPRAISFYSLLSAERKRYVDFDGLGRYAVRLLVGAALLTVGGYYLFRWLGCPLGATLMLLLPLMVSVGVLSVKAKKFDHHPSTTNDAFRVPAWGVAVVLMAVLLTWGCWPTSVKITDHEIRFTGMYGCTIPFEQIRSVELMEQIPRAGHRSNGFSFGGTHKGYFRVTDWGRCRLLVRQNRPGPYLVIEETDGMKTIFKGVDTVQMVSYRNLIQQKLEEQD